MMIFQTCVIVFYFDSSVVLAKRPGNQPAVWVWTGKTVRFSSRTVQKPDPLLLGRPNLAPYPSTHRFRWVWLDPSCPISGSAFQVVLFMVPFKYPNDNSKILTMVCCCSFWMHWPPSWSECVDKRSQTHPGNERQHSVNDFRYCILSTQSGHWLQRVISEVLASFIRKSR